jgi:hypothetical protein
MAFTVISLQCARKITKCSLRLWKFFYSFPTAERQLIAASRTVQLKGHFHKSRSDGDIDQWGANTDRWNRFRYQTAVFGLILNQKKSKGWG